jgi:hypothetical protein
MRTSRFLVERIMSFNVFGCPMSSLITHKDILANKSKEPTAYRSCGIWIQASYINHSCTSNAHRAFIGDMMIVRASQDLEPGTEITFWYQIPADGTVKKDLQEGFKNWEFVCDCAICQDAKETKAAVVAERKKLSERMQRVCNSSAPNNVLIDKTERLLTALNKTYTQPPDQVPRLSLWEPQLMLARIFVAHNNMNKCLEAIGKVLTTLGFIVVGADSSSASFRVVKWGVVMDHLVEAFLHARTAFEAIGAWEDSRRAEEYAKVTYSIAVGESASFESTHGR